MRRISVVGATGSGKTTVATAIGDRLGLPVIEMDALFWGPDWTQADRDGLRAQVAGIVDGEGWVIDGNYRGMSQDLVWEAADTIVWLDLPFLSNAWQLLRRTWRRAIRRERLWNGNRETLRKAVFSKDSILRWLIETHGSIRDRYGSDMASGRDDLTWVRLRNRREVDAWLAALGDG